jgi:hypothetical protein
MSLPPLASVETFESFAGRDINTDRAAALLDFASALIRAEAGVDWVDDNNDLSGVPDVIPFICCKVVERAVSNPEGLTAESVVNYRAEYGNSSSDLYLTKQERRLVRKAAGTALITTVELESPYRKYDPDDIYTTVANGGEEIPMGPWPYQSNR